MDSYMVVHHGCDLTFRASPILSSFIAEFQLAIFHFRQMAWICIYKQQDSFAIRRNLLLKIAQ